MQHDGGQASKRQTFVAPHTPDPSIDSDSPFRAQPRTPTEKSGLQRVLFSDASSTKTRRRLLWRRRRTTLVCLVASIVLVYLLITSRVTPAVHDVQAFLDSRGLGHILRSDAKTSVELASDGIAYFDVVTKQKEHPIHALIRNATKSWDEKVAKQSKTLSQAVREYKRRYKRQPPKGFDDWFRFAQKSKVVLVDEYDSIETDIKPFLALEPAHLHETMRDYASWRDVETIIVGNGKVDLVPAWPGSDGFGRTQSEMQLIEECCASWLQPANISITSSDGPSVFIDAELKERHLRAVEEGKLLSPADAEAVTDSVSLGWHMWARACGEKSRLRRAFLGIDAPLSHAGPSFIYDHARTMDLCEHPDLQSLHGFVAWNGPQPTKYYPVFSYARSAMHGDLRLVPLEQYHATYDYVDPEWEDKPFAKIGWRGATTGTSLNRGTRWPSSHRLRMYFIANNSTGPRTVRFPFGNSGVIEKRVDSSEVAKKYLDVAFVGDIAQCDDGDGTCATARSMIHEAEGWNNEQLMRFKYLVDLDGNTWSGRFHRLMSSNSLVLKSTIFPEWWTERIQPWLQCVLRLTRDPRPRQLRISSYVPLKVNYEDLFDIMSFFAGDLNGQYGHDDLAHRLASEGKRWAAEHWRVEDMQAYATRLYLEWARASASDRDSMNYRG